jgi:hypothetical protein
LNYLLNRANTYPINRKNKDQELVIINEILKNNGYQQLISNSKHQTKKHIQIPPTPLKDKRKWATFTYFGPDTRIFTKLFRDTNIKIAFKTVNTIQHHLRAREAMGDACNQSGIYQLECNERGAH